MCLSEPLLANALHALPLGGLAADRPEMPHLPDPPPLDISERITPIASHPKFVPESAAALDMRAIDGLRELSLAE